jgi:hypothetical protein
VSKITIKKLIKIINDENKIEKTNYKETSNNEKIKHSQKNKIKIMMKLAIKIMIIYLEF